MRKKNKQKQQRVLALVLSLWVRCGKPHFPILGFTLFNLIAKFFAKRRQTAENVPTREGSLVFVQKSGSPGRRKSSSGFGDVA
jgi:hypothetical protein